MKITNLYKIGTFMIKKILTLAVLAVSALTASAQTPMPLNPAVKHGTLPNGLNYYIMHNEEPKERANFYIAQKVGSTLETPEQLGLAHFLEHMAFNGTTNYPGKNMLNYLQSKGIRFGADINAYTSYDETVYNINNVPTTDKALMDSVLLAIHDWSGEILLEGDEIDSERGVIEEEWRSRNDAMTRWRETFYKDVYEEYQYQQSPIGKMEVVRNFDHQVLRDYYHKWYRPDQQGIVIVGDFDVNEMEKKVIDLFSTIKMPENPAERTYPQISDNKEPLYSYFTDAEFQYSLALVMFKSEVIPFEYKNTVEAYLQESIINPLFCIMINNRLAEYAQDPECQYMQASVNMGDFLASKTKAAFSIEIIGKEDLRKAYNQAMSIVARACKTGFMESELSRAREILLSSYEKAYNERNNTKSDALGRELYRHFIDNEPSPGIETEYTIAKQYISMIPTQAFNEMGAQLLTKENQVIIVAQPDREGIVRVQKDDMVGDLQNIIDAEYEAYVDEVITDPLIEKLPKPGKIKSEKAGEFGTTYFTLSNGVKVIVKPTDFKQDEIIMTAYKEGGKQAYDANDAVYVHLLGDAYESSKLGQFDKIKLSKYLAGKKCNLGYTVGNTVNSFEGSTTVKDLPTFMELVYSSFANLNPDQKTYDVAVNQAISILTEQANNPQTDFSRAIQSTLYGNNPMFQTPTAELYKSGDYAKELELYKKSVANAADYTFIFVGNIDIATFKPLLEQYIATLPSKKKPSAAPQKLSSIKLVSGKVDNTFLKPMQSQLTIIMTNASGENVPYSIENSVKIDLLGDILSNVYTNTLREEEGGTYSPYAYGGMSPYTGQWQIISVIQTNDKIQDKLMKRAYDEFINLLKNGADEAEFVKVKEAALKQYENNVRSNSYWNNRLLMLNRGYDTITTHRSAIENLTLAEFNEFCSTLYDEQNFIKVVMQGVEEKK